MTLDDTGTSTSHLRTAAKWSYAQTLGKMAITTGLSLVLAAMLGPRAFGVIAMALVFVNFIEMLQQQGIMPAIIARKTLRDEHADTAFWMVTGVGLVCTLVGVLAAPWWAGVNGLPELAPVIQVLALGVPLTSTVVVHEAILRRRLAFKKLAVRTWASVVAGGLAGLGAALAGWGVWALVTQQLVMAVTAAVALWTIARWRPRLRFDAVAARELRQYSVRSAASSLGLFLGGRLDVVLAGVLFGPAAVGIYRMGQRLTSMVVDVTARGMQSVSLPGLAALQDDSQRFTLRLAQMQRFTMSLALPLLGVVVGAAPTIEATLGPEWEGSAVAIRLLGVAQAITVSGLLLGPAMQARGRPGTLAIVLWSTTGVSAAALLGAGAVSAAASDVVVLCAAVIAASVVNTAIMLGVSRRVLGLRLGVVARSAAPGLAGALVGGAVAHLVSGLAAGMPGLLSALVAGTSGLCAAACCVGISDDRVRSLLVGAVRRRAADDRARPKAQAGALPGRAGP